MPKCKSAILVAKIVVLRIAKRFPAPSCWLNRELKDADQCTHQFSVVGARHSGKSEMRSHGDAQE